MDILEELKKVTDKEKQMEILKNISSWYNDGVLGPIIPKNKKELNDFIHQSLKEWDTYSVIEVKAHVNQPCMMLKLIDEIFIGNYYEIINQYVYYVKLNNAENEVFSEKNVKYLNIPNKEKIKILLKMYEEEERYPIIKEICYILSNAIFPNNNFNKR